MLAFPIGVPPDKIDSKVCARKTSGSQNAVSRQQGMRLIPLPQVLPSLVYCVYGSCCVKGLSLSTISSVSKASHGNGSVGGGTAPCFSNFTSVALNILANIGMPCRMRLFRMISARSFAALQLSHAIQPYRSA